MSKVYISSTFRDLKRCRKAVSEAVRMLGHQDVAMEHYSADPRPPLDKCLADVRDCDIYVGIFGRRYGYIPSGTQRSITEQEFREAERSEKEVLIFLLAEEAGDWMESNDETPAQQTLQDALRQELSKRFLVGHFSSCSDLKIKVMAALANLDRAPGTPFNVEQENNLLARLDEKDQATRERAARALVDIGSAAYAGLLRMRLRRGKAAQNRRSLDVAELAQIEERNHRVMAILRDLLRADDPSTRAAVIWEFAQRAQRGKPVTDEDVMTILSYSGDESVDVRREVGHSLWKFLPKVSESTRQAMEEPLMRLIGDENDGVRATASYSLRRLRQF